MSSEQSSKQTMLEPDPKQTSTEQDPKQTMPEQDQTLKNTIPMLFPKVLDSGPGMDPFLLLLLHADCHI